MARNFDSSGPDHVTVESAVVSAPPLTFAAWIKATSDMLGAEGDVIDISRSSNTLPDIRLVFRGDLAGDPISMRIRNDAGTIAAASLSGVTEAWHHVAGVYDGSQVEVYLDGVASGSPQAIGGTFTGFNRTRIGAAGASTGGMGWDGDIAEAAIYDAALSARDINSLAKGFSPRLVRPHALVLYQDLIRPINRPGIGPAMTATGTSVSAHPRMYYPPPPPFIHKGQRERLAPPFLRAGSIRQPKGWEHSYEIRARQ